MPILSDNLLIVPGDRVQHPQCPEFGLGRVQTVVDGRITVNFENVGKIIIDGSKISLEIVTI
ncbi:MAG: DUF3553 domain-containing protein [Magnetovibrio sp.]|nr:DUF3553 domain-containing protein [Magnetovibrio sp.]